MLTDEERKALVANKVRRSRETWAEAKGIMEKLYELRQTGDYDDWKVVTEDDVMPLVPTVEVFLDTLEGLIRENGYLD